MTHKIAKKILEMEKDKLLSEPESNRDWELITALDIAIKVIENEILGEDERRQIMNNDLISREALKKHKVYVEERHEYVVPVYNIDNAPTVERPTGEWKCNRFDEHYCNKCGNYALWSEEADGYYEVQSNFCPNCGVDMREGDAE